jgi:hypothetical protein
MRVGYAFIFIGLVALCSCKEELVCQDSRPASVRMTGFTSEELDRVTVKEYKGNGQFDILIQDHPPGSGMVTVNDSTDLELSIAGSTNTYRISDITREAPHTETITHWPPYKKEGLCYNDWLGYTLNGEPKTFAEGQYIDIVK